jgi:K+-sensing histidine kinase KdpD
MGLAICRSIVSAHDGELTVDKPAEAGAAFSFTLPAIAAAAVSVAAKRVAV